VKKISKKVEVVVYQNKSGAIELRSDYKQETIWATQAQITNIFEVDRTVVTKHINNILKDKELDADSVCAKFAHTAEDGKTYQVQFYSLDIILAVGYRANSARAVAFRQWATKTLRRHIVDGYTINKARIGKNYESFLKAAEDVRALLPASMQADTGSIVELLKIFANTWFSLDAYDKSTLPTSGKVKKHIDFASDELTHALEELKSALINKKEASELFGRERHSHAIAGIVGNIFQTFDKKDVYPTIEEKAAHLLYFIVKNHPFVDGNKRSGAFAFIWFLRKARILDLSRLTPEALTALTLLVAESKPNDKDRMIGLILLLIKKR